MLTHSVTHAHTHTHTHTHTLTRSHTRTHTRARAQPHSITHAHTHTYKCTHARTLTHTHTQRITHAHAPTRMLTRTHTHIIKKHTHTLRNETVSRTHARSHTVAHNQGVSICRTIYLSIYLALIVSVYLFLHRFLPSVHPPTLLFHLSLRCCNDARLRCNTVGSAVAPRCDGMLRRARRHHTTAPASSSPSNPMAECCRVPPEYPAIEPPALRFPFVCARVRRRVPHRCSSEKWGVLRRGPPTPREYAPSTRRAPAAGFASHGLQLFATMTRVKAIKAVAISDYNRCAITRAVAFSDFNRYKVMPAVAISDYTTYESHKCCSHQ
jgi:hypothetical protein